MVVDTQFKCIRMYGDNTNFLFCIYIQIKWNRHILVLLREKNIKGLFFD